MLDIQKMIASAEEALGWPYVSPGTNNEKGIDCSGLFVKIYRDQGSSIYHGSNKIARKYCSEIGKLMSVSQLEIGMAVFKWKDQQPAGYKDSLGDFSHIGLVVSTSPIRIIHASSVSGCVTTDTSIKNWKYWGRLKDVNYSGGESMIEVTLKAKVVGGGLNLRTDMDTKAVKLTQIPNGTIVVVTGSDPSGWSRVEYNGYTGYAKTMYLEEIREDNTETVNVNKKDLENIYDMIGDMLGLRG